MSKKPHSGQQCQGCGFLIYIYKITNPRYIKISVTVLLIFLKLEVYSRYTFQ